MHIAIASSNEPEVLTLIEQLDEYQKPLHPEKGHHGIDMAALSQPNVIFAVVRDQLCHVVDCGAIVLEPVNGELKRMFTLPSRQGNGIARFLLQWLEAEAQTRGFNRFMPETSYLQPLATAYFARLA